MRGHSLPAPKQLRWPGQVRWRFRLQARGESLPCAFLDAAVASLRESHVTDARGEVRLHRRAGYDVAKKILPADSIGVLEWPDIVNLLPVGAVVDVEVGGDGEMCGARRL